MKIGRTVSKVTWTVPRHTIKKLQAMKREADRLYPRAKKHSYGEIIAHVVEKQFKDPFGKINEIKEQKRSLAVQMAVLDDELQKYETLVQKYEGDLIAKKT